MCQDTISCSLGDGPSNTKVVKCRNIQCDSGGDDILRIVSEQGKAIGELARDIREGATFRQKSYKSGKPRPTFRSV